MTQRTLEVVDANAPDTLQAADVTVPTQGDQDRSSVAQVLRFATRPVAVVWPRPTVDQWGRDARLIEALAPLAHLRWNVSVGGEHHLPRGGALIVINSRRFALTPISTALALSEALARPVRFVGRPDSVPFGPFLRRVGGLLALPDEIAGALRDGELVILGAQGSANPRYAGVVDHSLVAAAVRENVPVHVAATLSTMVSRQARVEVSTALRSSKKRRGPLAEVELAEHAQRRLQDLLDEMGGARTGVPGLGWLGEG
jgi:hypothetical protein